MTTCIHCGRAIEPVDGPGVKYSHRHVESKRICCWDVYKPEIATPPSSTPEIATPVTRGMPA